MKCDEKNEKFENETPSRETENCDFLCIFLRFFLQKNIFIFLDLRVKVKQFKESEKRAIFSTSPEGLEGWGVTNGHLVVTHREAKFKRALRLHFLTHFTKNFCCFLTPKVKSDTDMINPSIESSDFLFWHQKNFELNF